MTPARDIKARSNFDLSTTVSLSGSSAGKRAATIASVIACDTKVSRTTSRHPAMLDTCPLSARSPSNRPASVAKTTPMRHPQQQLRAQRQQPEFVEDIGGKARIDDRTRGVAQRFGRLVHRRLATPSPPRRLPGTATAASSRPFHAPNRSASRRASHTAAIASTTDASTITRYQPVRAPIVSDWPTAGGFGGYLTNGTRYTATKAAAASSNESWRGPRISARPAARA